MENIFHIAFNKKHKSRGDPVRFPFVLTLIAVRTG